MRKLIFFYLFFLLSSFLGAEENKAVPEKTSINQNYQEEVSALLPVQQQAAVIEKAQNLQRVPPSEISPQIRKTSELQVAEKEKDSPRLQGLVFISSETALLPSASLAKGIKIKDLAVPKEADFIEAMKSFLGKPITSNLLVEIKTAVIEYYWKGNYPLIRVIIPSAQDVTEGVIQVMIIPSRLGQIRIEGDRYTSDERLRKAIRIQPGEPIKSSVLVNDANWLESDNFRTVDIIYEPGEKLGLTDIVLHVQEQFPFKFYVGYENNPYKSSGSSRYKAGFNWGRLFWQDQQINFEFSSSEKTRNWFSAAGNYLIPLPWRHKLKLFYNYCRSRATAAELNIVPGSVTKGILWQVGARYNLPLPRFQFYSHLVQFGYDFKRSNDLLDYYGYNLSQTQADISQFIIRYEAIETDSSGRTLFGLSFYASPGNMTAFNNDHDFHIQRDGAESNYVYGTFNLDRYQMLGGNWSWLISTVMQMASGKLLATEEFSLGGHLTVRGYLENEVLGDRGFLLKNELRLPPITIIRPWKDELQFLAFVDFGFSNYVDQHVLSRHSSVLLSIGPGIIYKLSWHVDIHFDMGFQLKTVHGQLFGKHLKRHGNFGAYVTF